jgi:hypothetical protein
MFSCECDEWVHSRSHISKIREASRWNSESESESAPHSEKHKKMAVTEREKLRLGHAAEGAKETKEIREKYADVFKLPGDILTATTAAQHSIPTPPVPKGEGNDLAELQVTGVATERSEGRDDYSQSKQVLHIAVYHRLNLWL